MLFNTLEMRGIDPRTSHMLSERSTTWATSPDHLLIIQLLRHSTENDTS